MSYFVPEIESRLGLPAMRLPRVGTYRGIRGHHIHQAAANVPGGPSSAHFNFRDAIAIALRDAAHRRANSVQRRSNRALRGEDFSPDPGNPVRVQATGSGTNVTPSPWFEDMKAYYALTAAQRPRTPQEANSLLNLVLRSGQQLRQRNVRPVRVPTR